MLHPMVSEALSSVNNQVWNEERLSFNHRIGRDGGDIYSYQPSINMRLHNAAQHDLLVAAAQHSTAQHSVTYLWPNQSLKVLSMAAIWPLESTQALAVPRSAFSG